MTIDLDRTEEAAPRPESKGSWVELFPFVLFGVTLVADRRDRADRRQLMRRNYVSVSVPRDDE